MSSTVLSKVTIGTAVLQDVVARAAKGSTNQDIIPLSCLMQVQVKDNKLSVTTTDNINYLTATTPVAVNQPDIEFVVNSKVFSSLISKITTPQIVLSIEDGNVVIKGNGTYKVAIAADSDGTAVSITVPEFEAIGDSYHVSPINVNDILRLAYTCKSENKQVPVLFNYYADDKHVLATDQYKGCMLPIPMFSTSTVIPPKIMSLVPTVVVVDSKDPAIKDGVDVYSNDRFIVFESAYGRLYGPKCSDEEAAEYPADALIEVLSNPNLPSVSLIRTMLYNAVDRMNVLSNQLENNLVYFVWDSDKVTIINRDKTSQEEIAYVNAVPSITEPVTVSLDSKDLLQILSLAPENLNIQASEYGIYIDIGPKSALTLSCVEEGTIANTSDEEVEE